MVANEDYTRIDTIELKALIYRKTGHQRAEKYFDLLRRLFSLKLRKNEFDKFCIRTIGRENISLHNRLIRSILKNARLAKVPPMRVRKVEGPFDKKNGLQPLYGDAFTRSPRKGRSSFNRDCKFRDRPSPLGPFGKTSEGVGLRVQEQQSATELLSLGSKPPVEVASVEDGEEVEQAAESPSIQSRSPVTAPLGISINFVAARKSLCSGSPSNYHPETCMTSFELPDTRSLRGHLERKLEMEGLHISADCANLLNNGLDVFVKKLIEPCIGLAGSRCGKEHVGGLNAQTIHGFDGMLLESYTERPSNSIYVSMLDFRAAMESNHHLLGGDWPIQLERICSRSFEECK